VIPLRDGSAVILTTGKLLSPTGVDLVGKGMKPDVVLAGTPAGSITEDLAVKKALSLLKS
jgi:C-terminal processing protease CtpA/Prc